MDIQAIERAVESGRESLHDQLSLRRVFAEPIERDGATVIPVARVRGWGGSGTSLGRAGSAAAPPAGPGGGRGAAGAFSATPAGAYVIRDGEVSWVPATSPDMVVAFGCTVAVVALLVGRSIMTSILAARRSS